MPQDKPGKDADTILEELRKMEAEKIKAFELAYQQLCEEHGAHLVPILNIVPGEMPFAQMVARITKDK